MKIRCPIRALLLSLFFPVALLVVDSQAVSSPTLARLLPQYDFADTDVGCLLFDLTDGHPLEAHQSDEPRIPVSTSKIVTTVAALQILGADYHFQTSLLTTGEVREEQLSGNLYLRGGGDPTLTTDDLREFVTALQRAGIKRLAGRFLFDESFLLTTREIESQQPLAVSYNPALSALSVNYNRIQLRWQHQPGAPVFTTA